MARKKKIATEEKEQILRVEKEASKHTAETIVRQCIKAGCYNNMQLAFVRTHLPEMVEIIKSLQNA